MGEDKRSGIVTTPICIPGVSIATFSISSPFDDKDDDLTTLSTKKFPHLLAPLPIFKPTNPQTLFLGIVSI